MKRPGKTRKTFSLVKYTLITRSKQQYIALTTDELELVATVNQLFASGAINVTEAEVRLNKFITEYKRKASTQSNAFQSATMSDYNRKILNKFWKTKYETRELVDAASARNDFNRAVNSLGVVPVDASSAVIKHALAALTTTKVKRVYARLNEIRTFIGVAERLVTNRTEVHTIEYITMPELKRILVNVARPDLRAAIATLFATGLRLGESLALTEKDLVHGHLNIVKQVKRDGEVATPKRNKSGKVIIIEELKPYVLEFLKLKDKPKMRESIQKTIVETCRTVLKRHVHTHDLRHSHAIYLLSKGASLTLISLQLRNRIEVCQKYYSGFAHTDDTLLMLKTIAGA